MRLLYIGNYIPNSAGVLDVAIFPHRSTVRHSFWLIIALSLLSSCSSSSSTNDGDASQFANSEAVNERFGTLTAREASPQVDEQTRAAVVRSLNNFSLDLHRIVSAGEPSEGSVESGYSVAVALSLASAATGGSTYSSLTTLLGFDSLLEDDVHAALNELAFQLESRTNDDLVLRTANRVFVKPQLDLQTAFLDTATGDFGAPVTEADFAGAPKEVADEVNGWVSDQTDGFISTIISEFDPSTVFAILNAIFLDAKWQETFVSIGDQSFVKSDGSTIEVPSFGGRSEFPRVVQDNLTALEIPYGGGELAMLILMPDELEAFEASLNSDTLNEIINSLETADVEISVPNWKLSSELNLVELLSPLGLPVNPWDFERLVNGGTTLDVIALQRAEIEVDENGTRAAAVTLVVGNTSLPESLVVNKPFVYVLRDRTTGAILFTGRVVAP